MAIYRATIVGRSKPILMKADSAAKAKDAIVQVEALTNAEMEAAFGEPLWTAGTAFPADAAADAVIPHVGDDALADEVVRDVNGRTPVEATAHVIESAKKHAKP